MAEASGIKLGESFTTDRSEVANGPVDFDDDSYFEDGTHAREPTEIFNHPASLISVGFRSLQENVAADGSFVDVKHREVTFVEDELTELPSGSKISFTGLDSTLPMAFDNNRFFDSDDGYRDLLDQASRSMALLSEDNHAWTEPDPEMGLLGSLWRWFVRFFMFLTNDKINRLRYTRSLQDSLPFQTGYESFAINGVIRAFDADERTLDKYNTSLAFKNRNASRILVQTLRSRWDWIFHINTQITWSRFFDFMSRFPFFSFMSFPATENFPSSRDHALRGIIRMFWEGSWLTRFLSGKQQGVVTFDRRAAAQNLAAETTGFEQANRNQYGTYIGREKTNQFRFEHRLTTDESIVRTFMNSPAATMSNNGVEHVLRCLAKHWRNMLYQDNGNFAHQRMEQLNPFEILRFFMPTVLTVLANLRGRNVWDITTLGPFVRRLQLLNPEKIRRRLPTGKNNADVENATDGIAEIEGPCMAMRHLVEELKEEIVPNVCGGVPSRIEPFQRWLDAINDAINELSREAEVVKEFVASVDTGIKLGYQLLKLVDWHVPPESLMKKAVLDFIKEKPTTYPELPREVINSALQKLSAKDERTLRELVKQGLSHVEAAKLLLGRTCTLLERELRRKALDERIRDLSKGPAVAASEMERNKWYWIDSDGTRIFLYKGLYGTRIKTIDVEFGIEQMHDVEGLRVLQYIPLAEAIARAQKAFMTIELDYGKRFAYNAFMGFGSSASSNSLRTRLRRLITVSTVHCSELDRARLNVLAETKNSVHRFRKSAKYAASRLVVECKPQNVSVFGGGPTGLLCAIHCLHNVILTGGEVRVFESRDAFDQEGSSFERAQIVRLDARQIAMLRYHLGTGFEDVFIPGRGETDPHHGNTLPAQGFVEVTIKRLESMILDEVINLRSKDLLQYFSDSKVDFNVIDNSFSKPGGLLKIGDQFFDNRAEGKKSMVVKEFVYKSRILAQDFVEGKDYDIKLPREKKFRLFRLIEMDRNYDWYHFSAHEPGIRDVAGSYNDLPPIYNSGEGSIDPTGVIVESNGVREELAFDEIKNEKLHLDFSASHAIMASGKPHHSTTHFYFTTEEPYAVCCIEGIKISMGMHNFGEKRWGSGLIDDIRSHSDQNTRIIGDFTKSIALVRIIERMRRKLTKDLVWKRHFELIADSVQDKIPSLYTILVEEMEKLSSVKFRRVRLQTRFFELGNNYYLGMEFTREYDAWKKATIAKIAPDKSNNSPDNIKKVRQNLQRILNNHIDRFWYESTLEVIAEGDVYNPGGRSFIPQLYTIDSPFEQRLGELKELEAFRLFKKKYRVHKHVGDGFTQIQVEHELETFAVPTITYVLDFAAKSRRPLGELAAGESFEPIDVFEIIRKRGRSSIVRNSGGYIAVMSNDVRVGRASDLARGPNGYSESVVALASFPVAHVVSHRTLRINRVPGKTKDDGFITAFIGDAQASPHFMRYSGLTGAKINCMSFNNLVGQALSGSSFEERITRYAFETSWSNGEVVQRGTGANYGEDGFLRPGFPYQKLIDYLYDCSLEQFEIGADTDVYLSRDWKVKIAAAIVPRGLENDELFYGALVEQLTFNLQQKLEGEIQRALHLSELSPGLSTVLSVSMAKLSNNWKRITELEFTKDAKLSKDETKVVNKNLFIIRSVILALKQTIDYSVELRLGNLRISSELFNQPKPVDSIVDNFAVEAQNFANALTQSAAFSAATIALPLASGRGGNIASAVLGVWNISVAFTTMTNVARYRNRNEDSRRIFYDEKFIGVTKAVFSLMTQSQRDSFSLTDNPFFKDLTRLTTKFVEKAHYYNQDESSIAAFVRSYENFKISKKDQASTLKFMREIITEYIAKAFHVNSYVQEDLVNVYKSLNEMLILSKQAPSSGMNGADELFRMLLAFEPELAASIERGPVRYGFLKEHAWHQTALPSTLKFLFGSFFCYLTIAGKTLAILQKAEGMLTPGLTDKTLGRPVRDLTELYHATNESQSASMTFLSAYIVFCFSVFFSVFRLIEFIKESDWVRVVLDAASWAALGSLIGACIAVFHFVQKLKHLFSLDVSLGVMKSDVRIQRIQLVTRTQIFLVLLRFLAVLAAAVALPWSIILSTWGSDVGPSPDIPVYIAAASACAALAAAVFFFIVEFLVRYNLDPKLGIAVCEPFRNHIEQIKESFTQREGERIETSQVLERDAWEYTARQFLHEYRFDTVFAADRFGTILQHLQSGNKKEHEA